MPPSSHIDIRAQGGSLPPYQGSGQSWCPPSIIRMECRMALLRPPCMENSQRHAWQWRNDCQHELMPHGAGASGHMQAGLHPSRHDPAAAVIWPLHRFCIDICKNEVRYREEAWRWRSAGSLPRLCQEWLPSESSHSNTRHKHHTPLQPYCDLPPGQPRHDIHTHLCKDRNNG